MGFGNATRKSSAIRFWASGPGSAAVPNFPPHLRDDPLPLGLEAVQVQKLLGHSDPGLTLRTCVHLLAENPAGAGRESAAAPLELVEAELPALVRVTTA